MEFNVVAEQNDFLDIKLLGVFDILYKGRSIFNKGKHSNKIFEILKYMIINNDKELSPEIICENIWPDTEYQDVRNTVTTYVFRLNKFLKDGNSLSENISPYLRIVCQKGNYKLMISDKCRLDIKEFSILYDKMERETADEQKIKHILKAMDIYNGELLSDLNYDNWVTPFRNYYRRIFSEMNRVILSIYSEQKNYKEVLNLCKKIFEVYALDEYSNIFYLKALYELNYVNEAITHYEYISHRFVSELGIQPSGEMKILYDKFKNKRNNDDPEQGINYNLLFNEESEFWKIFSNAIDDYMERKAETKSYSIGYTFVESMEDNDFELALNAFFKAIHTVLRKEDCYSFFEPNIVIFVLNDVPEVFYPLIKERIEKIYRENYRKDAVINISISPCLPPYSKKTPSLGQIGSIVK